MIGIPNEERQRLGAQLEHASQAEVMAQIPLFSQAEIHNLVPPPETAPQELGVLVFNMERGVHLEELGDFLADCPDIRPYDVILANELDDGCVRSGCRDTTRELAQRLGMNYVFGLEFIELVNGEDPKGHHGNAILSRWPIVRAEIVRLPEENNWYFDRQRRIGGRLAILAELDVAGRHVGVATIHLENRTHSEGRKRQLDAILAAAEELFPGLPVILGGDLNTNTFDGRDKAAINAIAGSEELRRRCLEDVGKWEACLPAAEAAGYTVVPEMPIVTRRKPLPPSVVTCRDTAENSNFLDLRLDWLLLRGVTVLDSRTISTRTADCGFAAPASALARFQGEELSDHNAVWASCALGD